MTHEEMIAVIQAHKEGKQIEWKSIALSKSDWKIADKPMWDFSNNIYRIAKPQKVKMWQWVMNSSGTIYLSNFHATEEDAKRRNPSSKIIHRADWTEIEVDAEDLAGQ